MKIGPYPTRTQTLHMPALSGQTTTQTMKVGCLAMATLEWTALEQKVEELIKLCGVLSKENRALRTQQHNWTNQRAKLIEKNELSKSRVESMIVRLKSLEQD